MKRLLILISAAAMLALVAGCATTPAGRTEKLLTQNGFKKVPANTAAQQQRLSALPPDKVSRVKRNGQTFYVYPDAARKVLYVGNKAQYQAFQIAAQDQYLAQDGRMMRDAAAAPVLSEDAYEMSGAVPTVEEIWEGWPE